MIYSVEYGLYDINCGGSQFINAANIEQAQFRAERLAHHLFFRIRDEKRVRFPNQKQLYEKVINDLHLPNTWDKLDATWEYVNNLYWSMINDRVWYKVEESPDVEPSLLGSVITWVKEEF